MKYLKCRGNFKDSFTGLSRPRNRQVVSHPRGGLAEGGQEPPGVVEVGQAAGAERGMDVAARDGDDPSKQTGASPSIPVLFPCIPRPDVLSPMRVPTS